MGLPTSATSNIDLIRQHQFWSLRRNERLELVTNTLLKFVISGPGFIVTQLDWRHVYRQPAPALTLSQAQISGIFRI